MQASKNVNLLERARFHDENVEQFAHSCISEIEKIILVQLKK